ncbi:MAG: replication-associated recombination protein A [Candidatus Sumerlaeia bacterium]
MTAHQPSLFDAGEPSPGAAAEDSQAAWVSGNTGAPLAERLRPRSLDEFLGQRAILGEGKPLRRLIESDQLPSMIFWGPPGCGKTTLARLIALMSKAEFRPMSAVTSTLKDVRVVVEQARHALEHRGRRTILFIDEIHRFNKAQQDAFLPHVERGTIILIGATTENPSFTVIAPLLSRCRVFILERLGEDDLTALLRRAIEDPERGFGTLPLEVESEALRAIVHLSDGDARRALTLLDVAVSAARWAAEAAGTAGRRIPVAEPLVREIAQKQTLIYDRAGEEHFNLISALHKSVRGSDPQAAVYWAQRILQAGEDPLYLLRRIVRMAMEDIGLAHPPALSMAVAARQAYEALGSPEGDLAVIEAVVYLATCPKSNSIYKAQLAAQAEIERSGTLPVPMHIRNAPTKLMEAAGYGHGYEYDHDSQGHFSGQEHLPDQLIGRVFYRPADQGYEVEIAKRMKAWSQIKERRRADSKRNAPAADREKSGTSSSRKKKKSKE